jgi:hypothetical protein
MAAIRARIAEMKILFCMKSVAKRYVRYGSISVIALLKL